MILDYQKIIQLTNHQEGLYKQKVFNEILYLSLTITSLLMFGVSRITIYGSLSNARRIWKKLMRLNFFQQNTFIFKLTFGMYCLDGLYIFYTTIRSVSIHTQILMCYHILNTLILQSRKKDNNLVEYHLKNILFRILDISFFYAFIFLEQSQTISTLFKSTCFLIQLTIIQLTKLINGKGELMKQHAKGLSVWVQTPKKPIENIMKWSPYQEKYPSSVNVLYNNNYYNLQNLYNTSPPEDIKTISIQFMFFNLPRTKRLLGIISLIIAILLSVISIECSFYNLMVGLVLVNELRK
ncbi:hypothetical protein pb186bvf_017541 [Paramecium bursaria]